MKLIRFSSRVLIVMLITMVVGLGLALAAPKLIGGQSYSVLSGSMSPVVNTGDMVAVVPIKGSEIKTGEIVAFSDPDSGKLFQHRVKSVERTGNDQTTVSVITQGDANTASEEWAVNENAEVGQVVFVVPWVGNVVGRVTGGKPVTIFNKPIPLGTAIILGLALIFGLIILVQIFREPEDKDPLPKETLLEGGDFQ
jgi:signal peptidase